MIGSISTLLRVDVYRTRFGPRKFVIQRAPYIVAYRIVGSTVRILRILHGARRWPEEMSDELSE